MLTPIVIGVSQKMYLSHQQASDWAREVARIVRNHRAVTSGAVELFVAPSYLALLPTLKAFAGTTVLVGAQDIAAEDAGAFTGEVSGRELAEVGARIAEVGHAERRKLFGETEDVVADKTAAALRNGLIPVLCVGEDKRGKVEQAVATACSQLRSALTSAPPGRVFVAYEPVWAIGSDRPASIDYIRTVCRALHEELKASEQRSTSAVIYGGSAGPGLLAQLASEVNGLFLGRFAHDPESVRRVLDEAENLMMGQAPAALCP